LKSGQFFGKLACIFLLLTSNVGLKEAIFNNKWQFLAYFWPFPFHYIPKPGGQSPSVLE